MVHIPIPIGVKRVAVVQGTAWRFVLCECCQQPYAYQLDLEATGEDIDLLFLDEAGSSERARDQAEENLRQKSLNCVVPIPCPNCGFYQAEMARRLKEEASINPLQIIGASVTVLAFLLLFLGTAYAVVLTVVLAAAGLALLGYGYVLVLRFDPNSGDPEPRKAIGQRTAVWGAKLMDVLPASAFAEPMHAPEPGAGSVADGTSLPSAR